MREKTRSPEKRRLSQSVRTNLATCNLTAGTGQDKAPGSQNDGGGAIMEQVTVFKVLKSIKMHQYF